MALLFRENDGGRKAAGFHSIVGDCVPRAICNVLGTQWDYLNVYRDCAAINRASALAGLVPVTGPVDAWETCRYGVFVDSPFFARYMAGRGFESHMLKRPISNWADHWCKPHGRYLLRVGAHMTAIANGWLIDSFDPREERRDGLDLSDLWQVWTWKGL